MAESILMHVNEGGVGPQLDITAPRLVEVVVRQDHKSLWVNVDGVCRLRICQIDNITWDVGDGNTLRTAGGYDQSG